MQPHNARSNSQPALTCEQARTAISALLDSEEPGLADATLARHLDGCPSCHGWRSHAEHAATVAVAEAAEPPRATERELTAAVLAAVTADPAATTRITAALARRTVLRCALGVTAVGQLLVALPLLISAAASSDAATSAIDPELATEAGVLSIAVAVGFGYAAARPATATAMLPVAAVLAVLFTVAGAREIVGDPQLISYHLGHLVVVLQAGLLWALARTPQVRARVSAARTDARAVRV